MINEELQFLMETEEEKGYDYLATLIGDELTWSVFKLYISNNPQDQEQALTLIKDLISESDPEFALDTLENEVYFQKNPNIPQKYYDTIMLNSVANENIRYDEKRRDALEEMHKTRIFSIEVYQALFANEHNPNALQQMIAFMLDSAARNPNIPQEIKDEFIKRGGVREKHARGTYNDWLADMKKHSGF